ncbi:MAG TPA: type II secretion system protein [Gemmatimonadaceae bacterium]|nr:type II secretion system protein [Gemmatimonadaceae bacterium]
MITKRSRRDGLTLPEVLVTLAIIAVIAAVMIPALTGQLPKGDAGRVAEDLKSIQTGMGAFVSDVRRYPMTLNQLTLKVNTTAFNVTSNRLGGGLSPTGVYTTAQLSRWRGPYIVKSVPAADTFVTTGFDGNLNGTFSSQNTIDASTPYVRVVVTGLDQAQLDRVDQIVDDGVSTTGLFRTETILTLLSGAFYALPIQ